MSQIRAVNLTRNAAKRLGTMTRRFERTPVNHQAHGRAAPKFLADIRVAFVKTTSVITARSGATPGTGTAVFVTFNGTALVDGTTTFTARNISAKAGGMATGKYGFAVYVFGAWWIFALEC